MLFSFFTPYATRMLRTITLALPFFVAASAQAATFTVTKTADTNDSVCDADCSLREAVIAANTTSDTDTIAVPAGTYTLTLIGANEDSAATGDLDILYDVTISGESANTTIIEWPDSDDVTNKDRLFHVTASTADVIINNLTLQGGDTTATISGIPGGGAIYSKGNLALEQCILQNNQAAGTSSGYPDGGAVLVYHSLSVNQCTFTNNTAGRNGGAIYAIATNRVGDLLIENSTFTDNTAAQDGGALRTLLHSNPINLVNSTFYRNSALEKGGAIQNYSSTILSITNSTLIDNTAGLNGGGIDAGDSIQLLNTVLAGNTTTSSGGASNCFGNILSLGHNLIDNTADCNITPAEGDQFDVATAHISAFIDTGMPGGGYLTLLPGSSAINTGSAEETCIRPDQLGNELVSICDIGAIETTCGNAVVEDGEACDDGNSDPADACNACALTCGNGILEAAETCDDGNSDDRDACSVLCQTQTDTDADGVYSDSGGDCHDGEATIYPGAPETCGDAIDQDCSGADLACEIPDDGSDTGTPDGGTDSSDDGGTTDGGSDSGDNSGDTDSDTTDGGETDATDGGASDSDTSGDTGTATGTDNNTTDGSETDSSATDGDETGTDATPGTTDGAEGQDTGSSDSSGDDSAPDDTVLPEIDENENADAGDEGATDDGAPTESNSGSNTGGCQLVAAPLRPTPRPGYAVMSLLLVAAAYRRLRH